MQGPLLVVTIDRLPAWIVPAYGATWVAMGALDALAARGVVCDRLIAPTDDPWANATAIAAAAAGRGGVLVTDDAGLAAAAPGIAPLHGHLGGAHDGRLEVQFVAPSRVARTAADEAETNLARLCTAAAALVTAGRHALVWCHVTGLGLAWDAPERFRERYVDPADPPPPPGAEVPNFTVGPDTDPDLLVGVRQAYAGQLTLLDLWLGRVLEAAAGWTVVVAGCRGMGLGLHGRVGPGPLAAYGELVHLPLIMADAAGRMAAQRYGGLVIPADVGATLAAMVAPALPTADRAAPGDPRLGRSLEPLFETFQPPQRDRVVVAATAGAAIVTPGWHAVAEAGRPPRIYAKPDDFFELCDVADRCGTVADELGSALAAVAAGDLDRAWREPLSTAAVLPG